MHQDEKYRVLKQYFGYDHFREGQESLINGQLGGRDVVGVMPTGAGKSLCFQVPALLLSGITLVISPLISLMKDQVNALTQSGIKAAYLNTSLTQRQYYMAMENAAAGMYKIIYVAPERLLTEDFLSFALQADISMVTIDEAHCISQWGQDFRPSYLKIMDFIRQLPKRPVISAYTATATPQVREDIVSSLQLKEPIVLVTGFDRKNLYFEVQNPSDKFAALMEFLRDKQEKTGIVYCATRKAVEDVCDKLNRSGIKTVRYHAGLSDAERRENQDAFTFDKVQMIVATNAFGMGIDKSNVSFVVHYNMPKNIESYYQEAGRAGRDGEPADCLLLYSGQDVHTNLYFIENSQDAVYENEETRALVQARDRERLKQMTYYCHTSDCLRAYILRYFGESHPPEDCGNCSSCNNPAQAEDVTVQAHKILACVKQMQGRFGQTMVLNTLTGSKEKRLQELGCTSLSAYGSVADSPKEVLRSILRTLVQQGYLAIVGDEYPVVKITREGAQALKEEQTFEVKLPRQTQKAAKKQRAPLGTHPVEASLLNKLKELRMQLAQERKVPAYVIFSDSTLVDMCMKRPKDDEAFLDVSGVGKVKLERFGAQFLQAIADFAGKSPSTLPPTAQDADYPTPPPLQEADLVVETTEEPVPISVLSDKLGSVLLQKGFPKVSTAKLGDWLVEQGYLQMQEVNGVNSRVPTPKGMDIGITQQEKMNQDKSYYINFYSEEAQQLIAQKVDDILDFVENRRTTKPRKKQTTAK